MPSAVVPLAAGNALIAVPFICFLCSHCDALHLVPMAQVYGLPTLMLFKDGEKVEGSHNEGAIGKKSIAQYLEQNGVGANTSA